LAQANRQTVVDESEHYQRLPRSFTYNQSRKPGAHRSDQRMADMILGRLPFDNEAALATHRNY
jgi:hypothetical protein